MTPLRREIDDLTLSLMTTSRQARAGAQARADGSSPAAGRRHAGRGRGAPGARGAPRTPGTATALDPYVERVAALVSGELARRVEVLRAEGSAAEALGDADSLADRMLAAVPEPSPWTELGPFYSTSGIARVLGDVSRQAIEDRRRRRTILALRTSDGAWVYPALQLDERNRVVAGLADVLARFRPDGPDDEWMVAAFVAAPQLALGGRTIVEHLRAGGAVTDAVALADERAQRWSAAP